MTHRVRGAFARLSALGVASAVVLGCTVTALAAQEATGKIEGTVTDQSGAPIASAQVTLVGTALGSLTSERGYYFMNNVPAGVYTVRAKFIGYTATEVPGVRVLGGQTRTANVKLTASAVAIGPVVVEAAANPIVPRDQVASKTIITNVDEIPLDDIRQVIALTPGVVESGNNMGLSLRGGRPGDANVYVDGAPVRSTGYGQQIITVGTNSIEEASVTTGALGVDFGNAQSGVIAYTTRSGGQKLSGAFSYATDEPFGNSISNGLNRLEGSVGGPVPFIQNLSFNVSGAVQGQGSCGVPPPSVAVSVNAGYCFGSGAGQDKVPTFVLGGIDTVVNVTKGDGSGVQSVVVPTFVQYGGECDAANNGGFECQGQRFPLNWNTISQGQAKLAYTFGSGSNVSLTGITANNQRRHYPGHLLVNSSAQNSAGNNIADPALYAGTKLWSRLAVLNWNQSIFKGAERQLSLNVNLSWAEDNRITGRLDPVYEVGTRSPTGGISFKNMQFTGFGPMPFPITDEIINNIRAHQGVTVPYIGRSDLTATQAWRMNPYGLSAGLGWYTSGIDDGRVMTLYNETRYRAFSQVDWQANRYHRFNIGGEYSKTPLSYWAGALTDEIFLNAYKGSPYTAAAWFADRLDLGDVVIDLGVRYDRMNAEALFPNSPGFISKHPLWSPQAATNDDSLAASIARVYTPARTHTALSPHLRVSFPITDRTGFRLSYAHQVNTPEFNTLLSGTNSDFVFTNTNDFFGSDIGFGKTILFEFGVRHAFSSDLVLDVSAYNKDGVANPAYRVEKITDPITNGTKDVNVLRSADFGYARGVDVSLITRIATYLNASFAYTLQVAKSTGSDPFSYLNTSGREFYSVLGEQVPPPEQALPTNDQRMHNFVGSLQLNVPSDWRKGTTMGAIFRDMGVFVAVRALSGLSYTRLENAGQGQTAPFERFGLTAQKVEPINSSTMPWTKYIDMRLNKGIRLGRLDWTLFADVRNLFNFRNVVQLFAETGDIRSTDNREKQLDSEEDILISEATQNGAYRTSDHAVILNGTGGAQPCSAWVGDAGPVNCVMLQRTEARWGNGDGTFTAAEQTTALNAWYDSFNGVQRMYGAPRLIRIGAELSF